jgi:adenylate cyclase
LHPESSGPACRGALALAHLGERDRAEDWAARALAIDPEDTVTQYNVACTYAILGKIEQAIDLLEKVMPKSSSLEQVLWFKNDSDLDAVRSHPRYVELVAMIEAQRAPAR